MFQICFAFGDVLDNEVCYQFVKGISKLSIAASPCLHGLKEVMRSFRSASVLLTALQREIRFAKVKNFDAQLKVHRSVIMTRSSQPTSIQ